jgi:Protein of unknown function (DUF1501)
MDTFVFGRRDFLRIGTVVLGGFWLAQAGRADEVRTARARACILLYMDGGPSHLDLWDLKPEAPAEVRGEFRPIATSVPGTQVCEHLPLTAREMHRLAQVRSVRHTETVHDPAVYQMLTGRKHISSAGDLTVQPTDFPQMGTAFGKVDLRPAVMPKVIELPETMRMGARILPGQNAGFLGATFDPFRVTLTPDARAVPPEFAPRDDTPPERLARRSSLLRQLDRQLAGWQARAEAEEFDRFQQQALALLARPQIKQAFSLENEPSALRDRYGHNRHGQSVLLARRLVEAGARFVTVYWGKEVQDWADGQGPRLANNPWDTHRNHFPLLKNELIPRADRALAALIEDLAQRGLLGETLVVWMGDFGRTPRVDRKFASRDHWPWANTVLFAGAGTPGGAVIGRTDRRAAEVTDDPVTPADLTATVFHLLGVNPRATVQDPQGQSHLLSDGQPIRSLIG